MKKAIFSTLLLSLTSFSALADSGIEATGSNNSPSLSNIYIYDLAYGGNGCPQGSLSANISSDFSRVMFRFNEYSAKTSHTTPRVRKSCNFGVGVHVPQGLRVSMVALDYKGFVNVEPGAYSSLQAEYFIAGEPAGTTYQKEWFDPNHGISKRFSTRHWFPLSTVVWSACGEDTIFRANTSIKAFQSTDGNSAEININRLQASDELVYQLQWKSC